VSYAVAHRGADGTLRLDQSPSLEEAVARAESLRNSGDESDVRVFKEVKIAVKAYYKVEVVDDDAAPAPTASSAPDAVAPTDMPAPPGAAVLG